MLKRCSYLALFLLVLVQVGCVSQKAIRENHDQPYEKALNGICPVMEDRDVSGEHYWVHEGKRYGLCCDACLWVFSKNPDKYLKNE